MLARLSFACSAISATGRPKKSNSEIKTGAGSSVLDIWRRLSGMVRAHIVSFYPWPPGDTPAVIFIGGRITGRRSVHHARAGAFNKSHEGAEHPAERRAGVRVAGREPRAKPRELREARLEIRKVAKATTTTFGRAPAAALARRLPAQCCGLGLAAPCRPPVVERRRGGSSSERSASRADWSCPQVTAEPLELEPQLGEPPAVLARSARVTTRAVGSPSFSNRPAVSRQAAKKPPNVDAFAARRPGSSFHARRRSPTRCPTATAGYTSSNTTSGFLVARRRALGHHLLEPLPLGRAGTTGAVPTSRLSAPGSRLPGADGRPSGFDRRRRSLPAVRGCSLDRSGLNSARPALAGCGHDRGVGQHGPQPFLTTTAGPVAKVLCKRSRRMTVS